MKVALVTPMAEQSAIANVMSQAVPWLSQEWDLEIWCPSAPSLLPSTAPVHAFDAPDQSVIAAIAAADLVVYVLGDSPYHLDILPLVDAVPGLVVLHDSSMTNLVLAHAVASGSTQALLDYVSDAYGPQHADALRRPGEEDPASWFGTLAAARLVELVAYNALGAVVHSTWHAAQLEGVQLGDVTVAPLPAPVLGEQADAEGDAAEFLDHLPADAVLVVTLGTVNANRGLDVLLGAISGTEELARVHLWAVGGGEAGNAATALAGALGLGDRFRLTGRVTDAVLSALLARADIGAALRQPVLEGASASALTQMSCGLPVIVYDHAHYQDLPGDAVVKVSTHGALGSVRDALVRLASSPDERRERGTRAQAWVGATRTAEAYALALLRAGEAARARRPHLHLAQDLGTLLHRLDLNNEPAVTSRVLDLAFEMFDLS